MQRVFSLVVIAALQLTLQTSQAQITLDSAHVTPFAGMSYGVWNSDTNGFDPGPSGANLFWDFSAMVSKIPNTTVIDSGNLTGYPDANSSWSYLFLDFRHFIRYSNENLAWYGDTNLNRGVFLTDPLDILRYPTTYQNTHFDSFWGTVKASNGQNYYRSGVATVTVDGFGDLAIPAGVVSDVLRVKIQMDYSDKLGGFQVAEYQETRYHWYDAVNQFPILQYTKLESTPTGAATTSTELVQYLYGFTVGVQETPVAITSVKVFPNPVQSDVFVAFELQNAAMVKMTLHDLTWRTVQTIAQGRWAAGSYQESFSVEGLPQGLYLLHLQIDGQTITQKVSVVE